MALVVDWENHEIDRYDTETGAYLGSFGKHYLSEPYSIAIDQANGVSYVFDHSGDRVSAFNYNTGAFMSISVSIGPKYFLSYLSNGQLLASDYGNVNTVRITPNGTVLQSITTNGIYLEGHGQTSDGNLWFLNGNNGGTDSLHSGTVGSSSITLRHSGNYGGTPSYLSARGNQIAFADFNFSTSKLITSVTTNGVSVTTFNQHTLTLPNQQYAAGTAIGHGGTVYVATTTGATSSLHRWVPGNPFATSIPLSQTTYALSMALVVAPEPGTIIGLASGMVAVVCANRRRATGRRGDLHS